MFSAVVVNGQTYVEGKPYGIKYYLQRADGTVLKSSSSEGTTAIFDCVMVETDDIIVYENVEKEVTYRLSEESNSSGLKKELDDSIYTKLPAALQRLYEKISHKEQVVKVINKDGDIINLNQYVEENRELVIYTQLDVIEALERMNFKDGNKRVMVERTSYNINPLKPSLRVTIFSTEYDGSMRLIKGRYKKDNRNVPNYPTAVETLVVSGSDIPSFSATSQEEIDNKVSNYRKFITMMREG